MYPLDSKGASLRVRDCAAAVEIDGKSIEEIC